MLQPTVVAMASGFSFVNYGGGVYDDWLGCGSTPATAVLVVGYDQTGRWGGGRVCVDGVCPLAYRAFVVGWRHALRNEWPLKQ